jgi:purine-binding chemotaxis protein CheW
VTSNQVLTFRLGDTEYGLGILCVQEIRGWSPVTRIPDAPPQILGVLNLRGAVVPIIDLRLRFGQKNPTVTSLTVIIVLSIGSGAQRRDCGLVVDGVSDVIDLPAEAVRPAPQLRGSPADSCVDGVATVDDRMLVLFNLDSLVGRDLLPAVAA